MKIEINRKMILKYLRFLGIGMLIICYISCIFKIRAYNSAKFPADYNEGLALSDSFSENEISNNEEIDTSGYEDLPSEEVILIGKITAVLSNIRLPEQIIKRIMDNIKESPDFLHELTSILQKDRYLWILVDRKHSLDMDYEPDDLVDLRSRHYDNFQIAVGQKLRKIAADSLEEMAIAAQNNRLRLFIGSSYRSYSEQRNSYARHVGRVGAEAADRVSALPGHSQHQLGLAVDFGYATYDFAQTREYTWLMRNISSFGWSLSFPRNYEGVTGYNWEPWHFRYVGKEITEFIDKYFDGIQHHAFLFLHEIHHF